MMTAPITHLDLGCGAAPRNPYRRDQVPGIDLGLASRVVNGCRIDPCNLALQPIPHPDASFDSVSAFDFLEHVPRVLPCAQGSGTRLPFVELMNEVWRVLKPGGRLYAVTPCYPAPEAFQDPTHVNIITAQTHLYFTGPEPMARMYGFTGQFKLCRSEWVVFRDAVLASPGLTLHQRVRRWNYRRKGQLSHLLWEFERAAASAP